MDALMHLKTKTGAGGQVDANAGKPALATSPWGMRYADNAGVISQSPEQLKKMMGVIVVVYAAFGLTVSEAKLRLSVYAQRGCQRPPPYSA